MMSMQFAQNTCNMQNKNRHVRRWRRNNALNTTTTFYCFDKMGERQLQPRRRYMDNVGLWRTRKKESWYNAIINLHFVSPCPPPCPDNAEQVLPKYRQWQLRQRIHHPTDIDAKEACWITYNKHNFTHNDISSPEKDWLTREECYLSQNNKSSEQLACATAALAERKNRIKRRSLRFFLSGMAAVTQAMNKTRARLKSKANLWAVL